MARMRYLSILFLIVTAQLSAFAQDYEKALGVRVGYTSGISYKRFSDDVRATEILMSFQRSGAQLWVLRQFYFPLAHKRTDRFFVYFGYGANLGFSYWRDSRDSLNGVPARVRQPTAGLGINGSLGLEYHFIKQPLVIALDWKPFYEINVPKYYNRKRYYDLGVSVRYILD